jgi:O-acetyl-ADP-ribose deacetylase (regulator of RNase III)
VLLLAGESDPVEIITARARKLVLRAIDAGWSGPPFDPVALAEILKIQTIPTDAVRDARTVPVGSRGVRIEFNPTRPRGRVRFSVAHEIAHTIFPDCAEQIRNRSPHVSLEGDTWQLEALCNIAASEIVMPLASLDIPTDQPPSIEELLQERQRFDVSTEALFIRSARVSETPLAMFTASRSPRGRYRVDYVIPSPTFDLQPISAGLILPPDTVIAECMNIGFTSSGDERWGRPERRIHIESVGIPPYPGGAFPRVAGLLWESEIADDAQEHAPFLRYVRGDATEPRGERSLIVHVVNDASPIWGGTGIAASLRNRYPSLQKSFKIWWTSSESPRLGRVHLGQVGESTWVASVVAQHGYGPSSTPRIRYEALADGLALAAAAAANLQLSVHMPRIGAGQAGGNWDVIQDLIRDAFGRTRQSVTIYDLPFGSTRDQKSGTVEPESDSQKSRLSRSSRIASDAGFLEGL